MAYNKQYNTRFSGRYNTPGQFVPAGEPFPQPPMQPPPPRKQQPPPPNTNTNTNLQTLGNNLQSIQTTDDVEMKVEAGSVVDKSEERPPWMKSKLPGVRKVSNKERRRRQNESLRRLLTPKNALMVLNEMMPNEQVANQFKVEMATNNQFYKTQSQHSFCADLNLDGNSYKGYGENKLMARNAAAEQAIRDYIIKKMHKVTGSDAGSTVSDGGEEEALPMIQLASFALHKLFAEWEYEGHKVPQLKPTAEAEAPARRAKELPGAAGGMHPCMLLTYMRPHLEYRELSVEGDRPQNMLFTMGVDVDGTTYIGKASNKKEARKQAAAAACKALFNVEYTPPAPAPAPAPAAAVPPLAAPPAFPQ